MDRVERVAQEQSMRDSGMTYAEIGAIVGVTGQTVRIDLNPDAKERDRKSSREYGMAHRSETSARALAWNKAHPEARKRAMKRDYEKHTARYRSNWATYNAIKLGATVGNLAEIAEIYRQAREDEPIRCYLCGKLIPLGKGTRNVDHVVPLQPEDDSVEPGKHAPSNLKITHAVCNKRKGNKLLAELDWVI